jgi:ketosteroid isomerase-like protein
MSTKLDCRGAGNVATRLRRATADLGYVVYLEHAEVQLAGSDEMVPSTLRVTMIFRREGDNWKVAHRHADPITATRPVSTIIDK